MMRFESPAARAFSQLVELARKDGYGEAWLFALAWLAAGRMVTVGNSNVAATIHQLAELDAWKALVEAGYPAEGMDHAVAQRTSKSIQDLGRRAAATSILVELHRELGDLPWDVLPCFIDGGARRGEAEGTVVPELAALLFDLLGAPDACELWIPFDLRGQLTIEALRRGWRVLAASPLLAWTLPAQLLLTIEAGQPDHPNVRREVDRDSAGRPISRADYSLVMPPFGLQVKDSRLAMWDASGGKGLEHFARSESWAIHEFVNRANKRAVFVATQGVLFAKGQEQRLREYLLQRGGECNEVEAVISLPPGVFGATGIAGALLVINPGGGTDDVYMADLGSGRRSLQEAGAIVAAGRDIALGKATTQKARYVSRDEIAANEHSLAPSRYLRRVADLGASAVPLGDICMALRPPTTSKDPSPFEVAEVGQQDLNHWKSISHELEKTTYLKTSPKTAALVQPGDIVFSIKGTVGKAALMGDAVQDRPTVVSQSCLALRPSSDRVLPQYLLMYLRSPHGQAQLEGLQVGAGVQHISPSTLLNMQVPVPPLEVQREACADYDRLCELEAQVVELQDEIGDLTKQRWPAEVQ
ncbi:type I restriction-modification system subunit M/S [Variovorax sp. dw_954]|uniref:type I restriction-modification system subunit M/S n=1 Tax=Variovorax sp. dw_954 TaxID=2720078 RepID=UPI001BD39DD4|nr:type I restriction-modification system subunit M/S [Variovorax sp. dw_954]